MSAAQSPLKSLLPLGQSVWLDYISRDLLDTGGLQRLIETDGVRGLTSNPAIFEKAIAGSSDYDAELHTLAERRLGDAAICELLAIADIRRAADLFREVYTRSEGRDGFVSLEVSPRLAFDAELTLTEARRLWRAVDRPNLMIKVPGTPAGVTALRTLIGEGINVNVTLLFAQSAWRAIAEAYLDGLERFAAKGGDISTVASVASFFISRIDTAMDAEIGKRVAATKGDGERAELEALLGKVAIANAKLTYLEWQQLHQGERWKRLAGARPQRLLWASTGTKNPKYRDVLYIEELIGSETVNTMPPATMDAFRDHGQARASLAEGVEAAQGVMAAVQKLGLPLTAITDRLVAEGVQLFVDADDKLLAAVAGKRQALEK
jgi:transaldolase/glucose-6-phosphate isomerase